MAEIELTIELLRLADRKRNRDIYEPPSVTSQGSHVHTPASTMQTKSMDAGPERHVELQCFPQSLY